MEYRKRVRTVTSCEFRGRGMRGVDLSGDRHVVLGKCMCGCSVGLERLVGILVSHGESLCGYELPVARWRWDGDEGYGTEREGESLRGRFVNILIRVLV